jgi:N-acetyltransferase
VHLEPVTLRGRRIRLEPLRLDHVEALAQVGLDPSLWVWQPRIITTIDEMRAYVLEALDGQRHGVYLPFVIVDQQTGHVIGTTRYADISLPDRRVEIGWTWLTPSFQRTRANTEAKLLLLTHAFESLGVHRVAFKTDALNIQSRTAILRIGAVEEGTFRKHRIADSGRVRDMVYYSILDTEWTSVKVALQRILR